MLNKVALIRFIAVAGLLLAQACKTRTFSDSQTKGASFVKSEEAYFMLWAEPRILAGNTLTLCLMTSTIARKDIKPTLTDERKVLGELLETRSEYNEKRRRLGLSPLSADETKQPLSFVALDAIENAQIFLALSDRLRPVLETKFNSPIKAETLLKILEKKTNHATRDYAAASKELEESALSDEQIFETYYRRSPKGMLQKTSQAGAQILRGAAIAADLVKSPVAYAAFMAAGLLNEGIKFTKDENVGRWTLSLATSSFDAAFVALAKNEHESARLVLTQKAEVLLGNKQVSEHFFSAINTEVLAKSKGPTEAIAPREKDFRTAQRAEEFQQQLKDTLTEILSQNVLTTPEKAFGNTTTVGYDTFSKNPTYKSADSAKIEYFEGVACPTQSDKIQTPFLHAWIDETKKDLEKLYTPGYAEKTSQTLEEIFGTLRDPEEEPQPIPLDWLYFR